MQTKTQVIRTGIQAWLLLAMGLVEMPIERRLETENEAVEGMGGA